MHRRYGRHCEMCTAHSPHNLVRPLHAPLPAYNGRTRLCGLCTVLLSWLVSVRLCVGHRRGRAKRTYNINKQRAPEFPNYARYVSTRSYVTPENMSSTIYIHLCGSERGSRKHVGVMYVWYTLFLPMSQTTHQYTLHSCIILDTATPTITPNHGGLVSQ
jgi:hypothetical protein